MKLIALIDAFVVSSPLTTAITLGEAFEAHDVRYAIGGALAYGVWGIPRATLDADINVFVDETALQPVLAALESVRVLVDRDQALRDATQEGMFVVHHHGHRVDLFTASIPFCAEAERTRVRVRIVDSEPWFLSAEALSVFKMLFFRPKDIVDLERLVTVRGPDLDVAYVRAQLVDIVGHDDARIARWNRLVGKAVEHDGEDYEVESAVLLRANKVFTVLRKADGTTLDVELDRSMLGALRDGDRVRIAANGCLNVIERGIARPRGR